MSDLDLYGLACWEEQRRHGEEAKSAHRRPLRVDVEAVASPASVDDGVALGDDDAVGANHIGQVRNCPSRELELVIAVDRSRELGEGLCQQSGDVVTHALSIARASTAAFGALILGLEAPAIRRRKCPPQSRTRHRDPGSDR
jgi:hypothetical protein